MALTALEMQEEGSHDYSYTKTSTSANFVLIGAFSDRFTYRGDLLNSRYSDLSYVSSSYVTSDDTQNLTCTSVGIKPVGKTSAGNPNKCVLNVTYTSPGTDQAASSDDINPAFASVSNWNKNGNYAGEAMLLNPSVWYWSSDSKTLTPEENPNAVKIMPQLDVSYTGEWYSINTTKINNCIGKVNSDVFLGADAGTLMLTGASFNQESAPSGAKWSITFNFGWKPDGWRKFWRQDKNIYDFVKNVEDSSYVFGHASFSQLNPSGW